MIDADKSIQDLLRDNNPEALDLINDTYGEALYRTLASLICVRQDVEDCFQELFIQIARKRHLLVGKDHLKSYLITMARNQAMAFFRDRKRDIDTVGCDEAFLIAADPADPVPVMELSRALAALSMEQREVISLKIPSVRALSKAARINPNTAHKVVQALVVEGTLEVLSGRGTQVAPNKQRSDSQKLEMIHQKLEELVIEARRIGLSDEELKQAIQNVWNSLDQ